MCFNGGDIEIGIRRSEAEKDRFSWDTIGQFVEMEMPCRGIQEGEGMKNRIKSVLLMETLDGTEGHKQMDEGIIRPLSKIADVTVLSQEEWFKDMPTDVKLEEYSVKFWLNLPRADNLVRSVCHLYQAWKWDRRHHYDYLFFTSYHTIVMVMARMLFGKRLGQIYIIHHNNIDSLLKSKMKSVLFSLYAKTVHHVIYENFIGNSLMKHYQIPKKNIHILPHPMSSVIVSEKARYDYVGISTSNDEEWVKAMIEEEEKTGILKRKGVSVVLRSSELQYDDGALKVFSGWLSREEYYDYATGGKCMILPFPMDFCYRMSGSLCDALSNNIRVVGSRIPLFCKYEKRYPHICRTGIEMENLIRLKEEWLDNDSALAEKEFEKFERAHSEAAIQDCLAEMFA